MHQNNNLQENMVLQDGSMLQASSVPPGSGVPLHLFQAIFENSYELVGVIKEDGVISYINPSVTRVLGFAPEQLVGANALDFVHPADLPRLSEEFDRALQQGRGEFTTYRFRTSTGEWRWLQSTASVLNEPSFSGTILVNSRDLTQNRQSAETPKRLAAIVASSSDAIGSINLKGIITSWNRGAEQMYGYALEEVIGKHFSLIVPPEDIPVIQKKLKSGEILKNLETKRQHKDGSLFDISLDISPLFDDYGRLAGCSIMARDITERKQSQALTRIQATILEKVASNATLTEVLQSLAHCVEANAPGLLCSILLLDESGQRLYHSAAPSLPAAYLAALDGVQIGEGVGSCGTAAFCQRRVVVSDIASDPLWKDYRHLALEHGLKACWCEPMFSI